MDNSKVYFIKAEGSEAEQVEKLFGMMGFEKRINPDSKVLIKPNLHCTMNYRTSSTSNPFMIQAIVKYLKKRDVKKIVVGEGPFYGVGDSWGVFRETGVEDLMNKEGIECILFDKGKFRIFNDQSEHLPNPFGIAETVFENDVFINLALMKTHFDTMVTLGIKNLKGTLRPGDKARLHATNVDRGIVELLKFIRPTVSIVDGTIGMEGMGPGAGDPVGFGHIFAGDDVVALDAIVADVMGFEIDRIKTISLVKKWGIGNTDLSKIDVIGGDVDNIRRKFLSPDEALKRDLPMIEFHAKNACSGCKLYVTRALSELKESINKSGKIKLYMGKDEEVPDDDGVMIGKCTADRKGERRFLNGCPPKLDEVTEFFKKYVIR